MEIERPHEYNMSFLVYIILLFACRTAKPISPSEETIDTGNTVVDLDGDGYLNDEDCDDNNAAVHPNASELCDGIDNNCNDEVDEGVLLTFFIDQDGDVKD